MYVIHKGRVCIMMYDLRKSKWVYIPEDSFKSKPYLTTDTSGITYIEKED